MFGHRHVGLFALYPAVLAESRSRDRSSENAPAGDYTEYLVAAAFGGAGTEVDDVSMADAMEIGREVARS